MNRYILYLTILLSKVFGKASNILSGIAQKYLGNQLQEEEVINSTQYNMVSSENEPYYADQYWAIIQRHLNLSLIHISEPTRRTPISYAVFCLKK
mgnify:CR=1 FL=1